MQRKLVTLLTIAGSDCTGGAGIQADIRAAAACGVYAMNAVTAVTAQNSKSVSRVIPISSEDLKCQLESISQEVTPDAVKIGMIGSVENGIIIADFLQSLPKTIPIVIDPVLVSSTGKGLADDLDGLVKVMLNNLFPLSTVVTPNINEAAFFLHRDLSDINPELTKAISSDLLNLFKSKAIILKGGHLTGDFLADTLLTKNDSDKPRQFLSKRIDCKNLHGTGCTYASILASELAKGNTIEKSFLNASSLINRIIIKSVDYDFGCSNYGPLNTLDYTMKPALKQ